MDIKLERPLVFLDIESTGPDPRKDRIVELSIEKYHPNGQAVSWSKRFNPGQAIPPEATAVHHITDADVANCDPFSKHAVLILKGIAGCDIAGFGIKNYDVILLHAECERANMLWSWKSHRIIDASVIFKKNEERTLSAASLFYLGKELAEAHTATADTAASREVLLAQIAKYGLGTSVQDLELASKYDNEPERADIEGKLIMVNGELTYNFGKVKGTRVLDDPGFGQWILTKDFSEEIKQLVRAELNKCPNTQ